MSFDAAIVVAAADADVSSLTEAGAKLVFAAPADVAAAFAGLGCEADGTWLLTDSHEALAQARGLGLRSCYVGKDVEAVSADIALHGWAELTPALLGDYERERGVRDARARCRVLIVCGSPEPSSPELVRSLAAASDYVIACDAGARSCFDAGVKPDTFVGDGDSADKDVLAWVRTVAMRCIDFPSEKYATDLALAIDAARHEATRRSARLELTLTCASGGRPDHALAVTGQLLRAHDASPRIVEDGYELRVLSPEGVPSWQLGETALNHTFSAVALAPATVISERGMQWELNRRELPLLGDEGISNVVVSGSAEIVCHAGVVASYVLRG